MDDIQFRKNYSSLISPITPQQLTGTVKTQNVNEPQGSFRQMLTDNIRKQSGGELTFSRHAMQRLDDRQIEVSPQLLGKMNSAVKKAESKGVTEALLLNGDTAFIVNIPNRMVVTTMDGGEMKDNIFTNIDGAVIL